MTTEPKITECWTIEENTGCPSALLAVKAESGFATEDRPAVLLWRSDYDAMKKEIEELRVAAKRLDKIEDYLSHMPFDVDEFIDDDDTEADENEEAK